MEAKTVECSICYYRANIARFTPITVSADFTALECPLCLNNDRESFEEVPAATTSRQAA